mgnify:CR=1 FL=1
MGSRPEVPQIAGYDDVVHWSPFWVNRRTANRSGPEGASSGESYKVRATSGQTDKRRLGVCERRQA